MNHITDAVRMESDEKKMYYKNEIIFLIQMPQNAAEIRRPKKEFYYEPIRIQHTGNG